MKKILPGSIIKNPADLQQGSTQDQIADRSMQMDSNGPATWNGSDLVLSENVKLFIQLDAGSSFAVNELPAGTYTLSSAPKALVARISRQAGTTNLVSGTYPNLNAGEYAIVSEASINANDLSRKDHVILFRTPNTAVSVLDIPLHKISLMPGESIWPGTFPANNFYADLHDPLSTTLPTGASPVIDGVTVTENMLVLFSGLSSNSNRVYKATNVLTSVVWTAQTTFKGSTDPSAADMIKILQGNTYATLVGTFTGTSWSFNDTVRHINTAGDYWEETSPKNETIVASTTAPFWTVPALNNENIEVHYSIKRNGKKQSGILLVTTNGSSVGLQDTYANVLSVGVTFSAYISGPDVVIEYIADGSGPNGTMRFWVVTQSDNVGGPAGVPQYSPYTTVPIGNLQTAFAMSDGSGIEVNCDTPYVSGGKTRLDLDFTYTMGINPSTTGGHLEVIVDGLLLPRYMAGVTLDAYYKEIDSDTIELNTDYSATPVSIEVRIRQGTIDTSTSNAYKIAAFYSAIVGSAADLAIGACTHTSLVQAITDIPVGGTILLLTTYTGTENITINKQMSLFGQGSASVITGTVTFGASANKALVRNVAITGNVSFNASSTNNYLEESWQTEASTVTDSGTQNTWYLTGI